MPIVNQRSSLVNPTIVTRLICIKKIKTSGLLILSDVRQISCAFEISLRRTLFRNYMTSPHLLQRKNKPTNGHEMT